MLLNTASQSIGAQMVSATDGSAFTGSVTVYVTGDSGTQAIGSVGSGICAHEGNGYHSYRPAQAETNYAHVAFTFIGTGAVPASIQVFTRAGDAFTRLGAPVGASISADIAAVQADTDNIQTRIPAALVSGRIDASVGAMAANVLTATAINADAITDAKVASDVTIASVTGAVGSVTGAVGSVTGLTASDVAAIKTKTDFLPSATAGAAGGVFIAGANAATSITTALTANIVGNVTGNLSGSVGSVTGAVGSVTGNVGGNVVGSVASVVGAVGSVTGLTAANLDVAVSSRLATAGYTAPPNVNAIADQVWDEAIAGHLTGGTTGASLNGAGSAGDPWVAASGEGSLTMGDLMRLQAAVAVGNTSITDLGGGNATVEFEGADSATVRVTATMTGSERTTVVLTP